MLAAGDTDLIDGGDAAVALAHKAVDAAFSQRIAELCSVLLRDARAHHEQVTQVAIDRFTVGYKLAYRARVAEHALIDKIVP